MIRYPARRRAPAWAGVAVFASVLALLLGTVPASAGTYATLSGSGSSWASVALNQWAQDMAPNGLTVNFNPDGSAAGRGDYMQGSQVDYAASDPPFRNGADELANTGAEVPSYGYSYVPDVGGGTAFMYHITVGGHLVTNLRLSELTLTKIFTGQITNWSDPAITHDYGAQLPNEPITPVIRSDGSGATYFFTRWMAHVFPSQWNAFCQKVHPGIKLPCPQTEFYPQFGNAKAENGSNNVSTYITSSYGEGSIGYDEYAYALNAHWPVVALANPGGYYVLPTASNVAVALTQAVINENSSSPDFLQQNLDNVYTYTDPRSYPLSSYSYLIVPKAGTKLPPIFNNNEGRSLSTFINFYLCAGQQQAPALGYSPLPLNLVQGGLHQVSLIPGHVQGPDPTTLAGCNNPTFTNGQLTLLKNAPYPGKCQKVGTPLNCSTGGTSPTGTSSAAAKNGTKANSTSTAGGTGATGTSGNGSNGSNGTGSSTGTAQSANITGSVVNVPGNGTDRILLAVITAVGVAVAVAAPPSVAAYLRRRRGGVR
ncbi:MAG TPA: substrate-binding domain-containing protein [Streptosporangiaceae bacterium]|nr:substrate-binding domain-containing protein [Streptosporangiaceae bacterium]